MNGPSEQGAPSMANELQRGPLLASAFGHALSDGFANFVPPLWFTVQQLYGLSDAAVGFISLLLSLTTNFGQPLFGYLTDRYRLRFIVPVGLLSAAVFTSVVGFMPNVGLFVLCLLGAGLGIALFHPRGGALAAEASGSRRAWGMSIFGAGGAVGYAAAALVSPSLHEWGLRWGLRPLQGFIVALPFGIIGVALVIRYNHRRGGNENGEHHALATSGRFSLRRHLLPHGRLLAPLFAVMVLRSATVIAYATFIQVLQGRLGYSVLFQGGVLFCFVAGAAIGGMIGGQLSERLGRRFVTVSSLLVSPPLLYGALHLSGMGVLGLLFFAGACLRGAEPINIAQTQELLPQGMSTASAIAMGFTWGVAGFIAPLVGLISHWSGSLATALAITCALPVCAAIIAWRLPCRTERMKQMELLIV